MFLTFKNISFLFLAQTTTIKKLHSTIMNDDLLFIPPLPKKQQKLIEPKQQKLLEPKQQKVIEPKQQKVIEQKEIDYYDVVIRSEINADVLEWCKNKNVFIFEETYSVRVYINGEQRKILQSFAGVEQVVKFTAPSVCG